MIVCVCKGVSERELDRLAAQGCGTVEAVAGCTGVGTDCGLCVADVEKHLERRHQAPQLDSAFVAAPVAAK